jgi:hypothetical protein
MKPTPQKKIFASSRSASRKACGHCYLDDGSPVRLDGFVLSTAAAGRGGRAEGPAGAGAECYAGGRLLGGEGRKEGGRGGGAGESLHWMDARRWRLERARDGEESESGGGGRRLERDGRTGKRDFRGEVGEKGRRVESRGIGL